MVVIITDPKMPDNTRMTVAVTFPERNQTTAATAPTAREPMTDWKSCFLPKPLNSSVSGFTPIGIYSFSSSMHTSYE